MTATPLETPFNPALLQGAVRLTDWGVIRAVGDDARAFLQGQLTQDVLHLDAGNARLAGYCSPKGRLLASFVVWQRGPAELLLACSADLLPATLKRLSMFVLRAKCKLSDASAELPLFGLAGAAVQQTLGDAGPARAWGRGHVDSADLIRLPDAAGMPRFLWAGEPAPILPALAPEAWRWLEVQSGVVRIVAATVDQFVPQMVNLEVVGGVNFQKGCYPGQEVVARSQYRGTLKRRTFLFDSDAETRPGQELFSSLDPEQPAGLVAAAAAVPDASGRFALLAETKLAALEPPAVLHLGSPSGPALRRAALPYDFPTEA
jgi:folate-binding protein YgfZ